MRLQRTPGFVRALPARAVLAAATRARMEADCLHRLFSHSAESGNPMPVTSAATKKGYLAP